MIIIQSGTILYILGGVIVLAGLFCFFPHAFVKKEEGKDPIISTPKMKLIGVLCIVGGILVGVLGYIFKI